MNALNYKSAFAKKEEPNKNWYLVDAEGEVLGRLAARLSLVIRGKNKADYSPHVDTGDKVVIINAEKIRLTGKKMTDKQYKRHTGYPGGIRIKTPADILEKRPAELIRMAVKGMLPKNKLQDVYLKNLFIYAGSEHPHSAQKPEVIQL